jgi:hypothetical protein
VKTDPTELEAKGIAQTVALTATVARLGAMRLLLARMDWDRLFSSANPPGAMTPTVARETLTRHAIRRKESRRRALRSGNRGLASAIRAA